MYTLIEFPGQVIVEAVVLVWKPDYMRVAAAGYADTIELSRSGSRWFTGAGQYVELDFLCTGAPEAESVSTPQQAPLAARAATGRL